MIVTQLLNEYLFVHKDTKYYIERANSWDINH